jgi:hypothetical protein
VIPVAQAAAMQDGAGAVLIALLLILLAGASIAWTFARSKSLIQEWADENGYRLLDYQYRWLVRGPFFWTTSKGQTVYRVTVEDARGNVRKGWVRCGSWLAGLWSHRIDVRWDEDTWHRPGFEVVMPDERSRDA